jgi:hypothetical protein
LESLAAQNIYGISFLVAYGATWIICGILWLKAKPRTAALCTLFQGMVAFPLAMAISYAIGAFDQDRPVEATITQLSILIGTSQMLGIPLLIYLFVKKHFTLMPYVFAAICSMHFVLYSWLYQTPFYIIMASLISVGATVIMLANNKAEDQNKASLVSFFTGGSMLVTVLIFLFIHFR